MHVKDLRREPPRRWNEHADGIAWLPRLIDKARAAHAGTLGSYLFGQSPMDRACLRTLGLGHRRFADIVAASADDDAVLIAIAAQDPEALGRARRWSQTLHARHRVFFFVLDLDDGYGPRALLALKTPVNMAANALTWLIKRMWRTPDWTRSA